MESSQFTDSQQHYDSLEPVNTQGATCDTFRVKLYGKLHFLKRLKAEFANDIRYQEAFRKEFETGYRLEHPHLVRYVSLADDGILMEYIDGETLTQRLANHPEYFKDKKNTDKFLFQLLDVVGYLHSHQVLHLDLKPDNILLTRINNDVRLIDLGCCYTDTFVDTQGRTNRFAAPEQLAGEKPDVRSDIYAIGKILELLPTSSIYNKVIARCTALDPSARYQSVEELLNDITVQHSTRWFLVAAVALMVIVSVGLFLNQRPETVRPSSVNALTTQTRLDTISSAETVQLQKETIIQTVPPPQSDDMTLMQKDLDQQIDKAYKTTIQTFCDSVFPSPSVGQHWSQASTEFHHQVLQISDRLVLQYPKLQGSTIRQEAENRFQNLVAYVFNRMRENGEKQYR